jgi:hypothetical protein
MEAVMRSNITRLFTGMAIAIGLSTVSVSAIGGAVAQSTVERAPVIAPEDAAKITRDRQQLQGYFLDGSRERLR